MRRLAVRTAWVLVLGLGFVAGRAWAQVGTIRFPSTGAPAAQADFLRGIALLHSFAYEQAAERFRAAERADPSFALPHWFEANTHRHALWSEENIAAARAVLTRLGPDVPTRLAKAKDPKERAYGAAVEALFADIDEPARTRAFADSMRRLAAKYRDDIEAARHVVVRVQPGGTKYQVFVISNKDENDAIVATKGPFDVGRGRQ